MPDWATGWSFPPAWATPARGAPACVRHAYALQWEGCGTPPPPPSTPATSVDLVSPFQPTHTTTDGNGTLARRRPSYHTDYGPPWLKDV